MQWGLCGAEHLERVRDAPGLEQFEYQVRFPHVCIHPLRQRPGLKPDPCYRKIQAAKPFDYDLGIAATLASRTIPRSRPRRTRSRFPMTHGYRDSAMVAPD